METKVKNGYFLEASYATGQATDSKDNFYLAAFSYKSAAQIENFFNWGMMYGRNILGFGNLTIDQGREYLADVVSYTYQEIHMWLVFL